MCTESATNRIIELEKAGTVEDAENQLRKNHVIPDGFVQLTRDMTKQIFYHDPENVEEFLANYLEGLLEIRELQAKGQYPIDPSTYSNPKGEGCVNILGESMGADGTWYNNLLENLQNPNERTKAAILDASNVGLNGVLDDLDGMGGVNMSESAAKRQRAADEEFEVFTGEYYMPDGFELLGVDLSGVEVKDVPSKLNPSVKGSKASHQGSKAGLSESQAAGLAAQGQDGAGGSNAGYTDSQAAGVSPSGKLLASENRAQESELTPIAEETFEELEAARQAEAAEMLTQSELNDAAEQHRPLTVGHEDPSDPNYQNNSHVGKDGQAGQGSSGSEGQGQGSSGGQATTAEGIAGSSAGAQGQGRISENSAAGTGSGALVSTSGRDLSGSSEEGKSGGSGTAGKDDSQSAKLASATPSGAGLAGQTRDGRLGENSATQNQVDARNRQATGDVPTVLEEWPTTVQPYITRQEQGADRPGDQGDSSSTLVVIGLTGIVALVAGYFLARSFGYFGGGTGTSQRLGGGASRLFGRSPQLNVNVAMEVMVENENIARALGHGVPGAQGLAKCPSIIHHPQVSPPSP